ncbi:hypothetical protein Tco_1479800, partial [Tanacetum coccineum]
RVLEFAIVVTQQLNPYPMSHVEQSLVGDMLNTLMVGENRALRSIRIMPPNLQCKDDSSKFKVMSGVIPFVLPDLS